MPGKVYDRGMETASPAGRGGRGLRGPRGVVLLSARAALAGEPPRSRYTDPPVELAWNIRASGVTGLRAALPRLRELSVSKNLDTALAAKKSIEDLEGPEAHPRPWHPGEREQVEALQAVRHLEELFPLEEGRR
jgi:hypothetical protein